MKYVDGFVLPLPKENVEKYREVATKASEIWIEHGALQYMESIGDDFECHDMVPFPKMAQTKDGETVGFAFIVFESKEHRDEVNAKVMADPRMKEFCESTGGVFDYKRMAYGGFKVIVEAS